MTQDQMDIAIQWLRANEGDNGEAEACFAVADWLEGELERRRRDAVVRAAVKKHGLPANRVREALAKAGIWGHESQCGAA